MTEVQRQSYDNLILLCGKHHKVVDNNASAYTTEILGELKQTHCEQHRRPESEADTLPANLLLNQLNSISVDRNSGNVAINSPGAVQAHTVNIKPQTKKVSINSPIGSIGADREQASYVDYLIKRYNKFAAPEPRERKFSYAALPKTIESKFGKPWRLLSVDRFDEVCAYLQARVSKTRIARMNASQGKQAYSTFAEHQAKESS